MRGPTQPDPALRELATLDGRGQLSRSERYLLAVGIRASSLAIAVAEHMPVRGPDVPRHSREYR